MSYSKTRRWREATYYLWGQERITQHEQDIARRGAVLPVLGCLGLSVAWIAFLTWVGFW